jgi:hypothetical protein
MTAVSTEPAPVQAVPSHKFVNTGKGLRICEKCGINVENLAPEPPRKRGGYGWWYTGGKGAWINGKRETSGQAAMLKEVPVCGATTRPVETVSTSLV